MEDKGYSVSYSDDDDDPGFQESLHVYKTSYDDDYEYMSVMRFEKSKTAELYYKMMKQEYDNEIAELNSQIDFLEHMLETYEDDLSSSDMDEYKDELKDLRNELKDSKEDYVMGYKGSVVWFGSIGIFESIDPSNQSTKDNKYNDDEGEVAITTSIATR